MAYGNGGGENVRFKQQKTTFVLKFNKYVGLIFLYFKDHLQSFKFHTHSFLNHKKWIKNERNILFEIKGYNVFFYLNDFFSWYFFINFLSCYLSFLYINSLNYWIFKTYFIMHFLCIWIFLFTYLCICVCIVLFLFQWFIFFHFSLCLCSSFLFFSFEHIVFFFPNDLLNY